MNGVKLSETEYRYGLAPSPPGDGVTYQPDVVLIGGGPKAIKSEGADGLTWTIDGDADHADELAEGRIMFASGRAVGRVLAVSDVGGDKEVILGPADLTEIYRDLDFEITEPINLDELIVYPAPGLEAARTEFNTSTPDTSTPDATATDESSRGVVTMPPISLVAVSRSNAAVSDPDSQPGPVSVGPFTITPLCCEGSGIGLRLSYDKDGTKVEAEALFTSGGPAFAKVQVRGGTLQTAEIEMASRALQMQFTAGSERGQSANPHELVVVPVDITVPLFRAGAAPQGNLPLNLTLRQTFLLSTGFSAKNSTLGGEGQWLFNGNFGFKYGDGEFVPLISDVTTAKSLLDTIDGVSVGINSFLFASSFSASVGVGSNHFRTGLHIGATAAITALRQSDIALRPCKQATLDIEEFFGVGWSISQKKLDALNAKLRAKGVKEPIQRSGGFREQVKLPSRVGDRPKGCAGAS